MPREPKFLVATSAERSRIMRAVRRWNTGPERVLQSGLLALGLRFSKNPRDLPGSPDIVFRKSQIAAFVHGCFWHRHRGCSLTTTPRSNVGYWQAKFAANLKRDRRKLSELKRLGWKVIVAWQCDLQADAGDVARRIESFLREAQKGGSGFSQLSSKLSRSR